MYLLNHVFTNIYTNFHQRIPIKFGTNSLRPTKQSTHVIVLIDLFFVCVGGWTSSWLSPGTATAATAAPQIHAGPPSTLGSRSV